MHWMNQSDLGSVLELKESVCKAFVLVATSVRSCIVNAAVNQQRPRRGGNGNGEGRGKGKGGTGKGSGKGKGCNGNGSDETPLGSDETQPVPEGCNGKGSDEIPLGRGETAAQPVPSWFVEDDRYKWIF